LSEFKHKRRAHLSRDGAGRGLIALGEALVGAVPLRIDTDDAERAAPLPSTSVSMHELEPPPTAR
jgi:hypothetical protein